MLPQYTCITCRVGFRDPAIQREHYKSDWHRYNLKRKVAELDAVTAEEFQKRVLQQREADAVQGKQVTEQCKACSKVFSTRNAYDNHLNSKKHKLAQEKYKEKDSQVAEDSDFVLVDHKMVKSEEEIGTDSEFEEVDSDEWEDYDEEADGADSVPVQVNDCLFCDHHSQSMVKCLTHMTVAHSFFVPDVEYCSDIRGLLIYLGEKVSLGHMCLWCNDRGRTFRSREAAQAHMKDKGHCKVLHEGTALAEYTDFYDYSSSYPDHQEGDEDMEVDSSTDNTVIPSTSIDDEEYELVLPSGSVIGHRSLLRYYKQNLTTYSGAVVVHKKEDKLRRVIRQYRMLGWAPQQSEATARKARDIHYMKRVQAKWSSQLGIKANKLQKHFRVQCNF